VIGEDLAREPPLISLFDAVIMERSGTNHVTAHKFLFTLYAKPIHTTCMQPIIEDKRPKITSSPNSLFVL
jgi:hypothetical protein